MLTTLTIALAVACWSIGPLKLLVMVTVGFALAAPTVGKDAVVGVKSILLCDSVSANLWLKSNNLANGPSTAFILPAKLSNNSTNFVNRFIKVTSPDSGLVSSSNCFPIPDKPLPKLRKALPKLYPASSEVSTTLPNVKNAGTVAFLP